jgi:hypothetical protein
VKRQPEHGRADAASATVTYRPAAAFSGKDFYEVMICAEKDGGEQGCSTIYFVATAR